MVEEVGRPGHTRPADPLVARLEPRHPSQGRGQAMLPPVSAPVAAVAIPAAIAAPEPPLEPTGMRTRCQ